MKAKTIRIIALLVILGVIAWKRYELMQTKPDEPQPVETAQAQLQIKNRSVLSNIPASRPVLNHSEKPSESDNPYAKKPEGMAVEFQMKEGYAVAYGDVLLGKPEPGFQGNRGRSEMTVPQLWEKPEIAYLISPDLPNPGRIEKAIEYFRQNTLIRFVPFENQKDGIVFEVGEEHCYSYLGKVGGFQPIRLSAGCETQQILHEMMHALGFIHEQSRPDRDQYLEVLWKNIENPYYPQFAIVPEILADVMKGSPFDYRSIMLYRPTDFAVHPDAPALKSKTGDAIAPMQVGLSEVDIQRLNKLYSLYE